MGSFVLRAPSRHSPVFLRSRYHRIGIRIVLEHRVLENLPFGFHRRQEIRCHGARGRGRLPKIRHLDLIHFRSSLVYYHRETSSFGNRVCPAAITSCPALRINPSGRFVFVKKRQRCGSTLLRRSRIVKSLGFVDREWTLHDHNLYVVRWRSESSAVPPIYFFTDLFVRVHSIFSSSRPCCPRSFIPDTFSLFLAIPLGFDVLCAVRDASVRERRGLSLPDIRKDLASSDRVSAVILPASASRYNVAECARSISHW